MSNPIPTSSSPEPTAAPAPETVISEVSETGVHLLALIDIGGDRVAKRYVTGVTEDGRVLATDNVRAAKPMQTAAARALLKNAAVKKAFPTTQIVGAE